MRFSFLFPFGRSEHEGRFNATNERRETFGFRALFPRELFTNLLGAKESPSRHISDTSLLVVFDALEIG